MYTQALRPRKRAKAQTDRAVPVDSDRVLIACFDAPNAPVEVSRRLLADHSCRLSKILEHDRPMSYQNGLPVYSSGPVTTRAVLVNVVRTLATGEVVLSQDVTLHEVLASLAYEGVCVRESGGATRAKDAPHVDPVPRGLMGVVGRHVQVPMHENMQQVAEQVALAILCWPRLESGLSASSEGRSGQVGVVGSGGGSLGFSASATRLWVMFLPTPSSERAARATDAAHVASLCRKWPRWLSTFVVVFEIVHARLLRLLPSNADEYSERLFKDTQAEFERDPLGVFAVHRYDAPSVDGSSMSSLRREIHAARAVSQSLRNLASDIDAEEVPAAVAKRAWARAVVLYAESVTVRTPDLFSNLSDLFCDEKGQSDERDYLDQALSKYGVRVVRWTTHRETSSAARAGCMDLSLDALCFPFNFSSKETQRCPNNAPCALLSVQKRDSIKQ